MKKTNLVLTVLSLVVLLTGCGQKSNESDVAEKEQRKPVPVKEKIIGGWTASIKFDNDVYHKTREQIGDETKVNQLDEVVENLMGTTFQIVFNEDGTLLASNPGGDKDKKAPGTYTVENDNNKTATLKIEVDAPEGKQVLTLETKFDGNDQFKSPWVYQIPDEASTLFFADFKRDNFAN